MRRKTVQVGILAVLTALLLTAGCITINVPGGTTEPAQPPTTTPTTPTTTPTTPTTTPTTPTTTPTTPTSPTTPTIAPTLPVQPTVPISPTLIPNLPSIQPSLTGTKWILEGMGEPGNMKAALTVKDVTLNFIDETKLGGNAGCNSYSGKYEAGVFGTLKVSDISSTLMLCTQPGLMAQEHDFLDALDEAESYKVVGGKLQITAEGILLVLVPA